MRIGSDDELRAEFESRWADKVKQGWKFLRVDDHTTRDQRRLPMACWSRPCSTCGTEVDARAPAEGNGDWGSFDRLLCPTCWSSEKKKARAGAKVALKKGPKERKVQALGRYAKQMLDLLPEDGMRVFKRNLMREFKTANKCDPNAGLKGKVREGWYDALSQLKKRKLIIETFQDGIEEIERIVEPAA